MVYPISKLIIGKFVNLFIKGVSGTENIPKNGSFLIASNHKSYLDPFIIGAVIIPRIDKKIHTIAMRGGAKRNFWVMGDTICRKWGACIPLDRADKGIGALNEAKRLLIKGEVVLLFPEGGMKKSDKSPRTGVVRLALDAKVPIVPIYLTGTAEVLPPYKLIPKRFERLVKIRIGKPINLEENNNAGKKDLRLIADKVMNAVYDLK